MLAWTLKPSAVGAATFGAILLDAVLARGRR